MNVRIIKNKANIDGREINYWTIPGINMLSSTVSILNDVQEYCGVDIYKNTRKSEIVEGRHVAMFLLKKKTHLSLAKIGSLFNQNHATVLHAYKKISDFLEIDKVFLNQYKELLLKYEIIKN